MSQEGPGVEACAECGSMLLGDVVGPRGRRADLRLHLNGEDGNVVAYRCPDCSHTWPRYPEGHRLHADGKTVIAWEATRHAHAQRGLLP